MKSSLPLIFVVVLVIGEGTVDVVVTVADVVAAAVFCCYCNCVPLINCFTGQFVSRGYALCLIVNRNFVSTFLS